MRMILLLPVPAWALGLGEATGLLIVLQRDEAQGGRAAFVKGKADLLKVIWERCFAGVLLFGGTACIVLLQSGLHLALL